MNKITKFTDLEVWKESHKLSLLIYKLTSQFPKQETFGLTSQLRRAVVSIESCIAEGFSRYHYKDRLNFYYDARGSLSEVETQSLLAKDLHYITESDYSMIISTIEKISLLLGGLIRSTNNMAKK